MEPEHRRRWLISPSQHWENVRSKDLGEVGELLSGVVKELKTFDEEEEKGGFFRDL